MYRNKHYFVYILASLSGTLYIGMTNNLEKRVIEHKEKLIDGFTSDYGLIASSTSKVTMMCVTQLTAKSSSKAGGGRRRSR